MHRFREIEFVAVCWAVLLAVTGCADQPISITGPTMGTTYAVKVAALPASLDLQELQAEIEAKLETVNRQMSTYRRDSELSNFNAYEKTDWFDVSPEVVLVVNQAQQVSELSGGAFDVTVGPLVNLWGFGPDGQPDKIPTQTEIEKTKQQIGSVNLQTRRQPAALKKSQPDVYVDLSAIAKGYAVDLLADYLESVGIDDFMVEIGGEVKTKGRKPSGKRWMIGIETPTAQRNVQRATAPGDLGMATSGDYRNYFEQDGKRYSHTIDPRTGRPIDHQLASVTVFDTSCMRADALATAMMVLGPQDGYDLAINERLPVLFVIREGSGFFERSTPAFDHIDKTEGAR